MVACDHLPTHNPKHSVYSVCPFDSGDSSLELNESVDNFGSAEDSSRALHKLQSVDASEGWTGSSCVELVSRALGPAVAGFVNTACSGSVAKA